MKNVLEKIGIALGFIVIIGILIFAYIEVRKIDNGNGPVSVVFAKTNDDADCTLIFQNNTAVMIDTGEKEDSESVLKMLDDNGIKKLNYLILTHGDKDHIGCVNDVVEHVEVSKVIAPYYQDGDKWDETIKYLTDKNIDIWYPTHNRSMRVGTMNMVIYPGLEKNYDEINDYSLAVLVTHKNVNMLFTGDALKKRSIELEMIHWPKVDLYKVPYHGRANSQSESLFQMVEPKYAVVTSKQCDKVIETAANKYNTSIYYSGNEQLLFISDGNSLERIDNN